jgi:hypothetical protein
MRRQFVVGNRAILTAEIHSRAMQDQTGMNPEDEDSSCKFKNI